MTFQEISSGLLADLVSSAAASPRLRQHRNIHLSYDDPCQRLLNAIGVDSYIRPHRHRLDPKTETLIAVRGLFALLVFDNDGEVRQVRRFGTERYALEVGVSVAIELPPHAWHTVLALVPGSVLLELKAGPFDPLAAKEPAPWSPEEGTAMAADYFRRLQLEIEKSGKA
jgi:cupin fold WbuC family metalloprotein